MRFNTSYRITKHCPFNKYGTVKRVYFHVLCHVHVIFVWAKSSHFLFHSFKMKNEIWFLTPLNSSGLLFGLNKFLTGF